MGLPHDIANTIFEYLTANIRRFTAFIFIMYTIGVVVGMRTTGFSTQIGVLAWTIPLLLALLSYMYNEVAIVFFLIFVAMMYLIGL